MAARGCHLRFLNREVKRDDERKKAHLVVIRVRSLVGKLVVIMGQEILRVGDKKGRGYFYLFYILNFKNNKQIIKKLTKH